MLTGAELVEVGKLDCGGIEADGESFDLAEPAVEPGLGDPLSEVADDLGEAVALPRVDAQHRAADAGVFVFAGCRVRTPAGSEFELAGVEVLLELGPLLRCGFAVVVNGPSCPAAAEARPVGADQIVLEHGKVTFVSLPGRG